MCFRVRLSSLQKLLEDTEALGVHANPKGRRLKPAMLTLKNQSREDRPKFQASLVCKVSSKTALRETLGKKKQN